jgi:hypothetical protein
MFTHILCFTWNHRSGLLQKLMKGFQKFKAYLNCQFRSRLVSKTLIRIGCFCTWKDMGNYLFQHLLSVHPYYYWMGMPPICIPFFTFSREQIFCFHYIENKVENHFKLTTEDTICPSSYLYRCFCLPIIYWVGFYLFKV